VLERLHDIDVRLRLVDALLEFNQRPVALGLVIFIHPAFDRIVQETLITAQPAFSNLDLMRCTILGEPPQHSICVHREAVTLVHRAELVHLQHVINDHARLVLTLEGEADRLVWVDDVIVAERFRELLAALFLSKTNTAHGLASALLGLRCS
jgi:hypothetical protein